VRSKGSFGRSSLRSTYSCSPGSALANCSLVSPDSTYQGQMSCLEQHDPSASEPLRRQDQPQWAEKEWEEVLDTRISLAQSFETNVQ
jgi:hypothetical protein